MMFIIENQGFYYELNQNTPQSLLTVRFIRHRYHSSDSLEL